MALPFNPLQLQTYDITQKDQARMFVLQLSNMLAQVFTPNGLAAIMQNSLPLLNLGTVSTDLGTVSTNQSVPCDNAVFITVPVSFTAAFTLTLTHLIVGSPMYVVRASNTTAGALLFKLAATNPAGAAYSDMLTQSSTDALIGLQTAGVSVPANSARTIMGSTMLIGGSTYGVSLIL